MCCRISASIAVTWYLIDSLTIPHPVTFVSWKTPSLKFPCDIPCSAESIPPFRLLWMLYVPNIIGYPDSRPPVPSLPVEPQVHRHIPYRRKQFIPSPLYLSISPTAYTVRTHLSCQYRTVGRMEHFIPTYPTLPSLPSPIFRRNTAKIFRLFHFWNRYYKIKTGNFHNQEKI